MGIARKKPEEAEINAYMEAQLGETISKDYEIAFLWKRYRGILDEYKGYRLVNDEAKKLGGTKRLADLSVGFRDNYESRQYLVLRLRELGEKVDDKFVALSQVKQPQKKE